MAADLQRYLSREAVVKGQAKANAEKRLADILNREQGRKALPGAWNTLLAEPDELLRDLLIESAEQATGSRPWREDAEDFLRRQGRHSAATSGTHKPVTHPTNVAASLGRASPSSNVGQGPATALGRIVGVVIRGSRHETGNGQAAMALLAGAMQQQNSDFLERYRNEAAPAAHKRRPAVRNEALDDELMRYVQEGRYRQVEGLPEWWIYVDLKTNAQAERMRIMANIAGLPWGTDEGVRLIHRAVG